MTASSSYLILDVSGSMTYRASPASPQRRCEVCLHALQLLLAGPSLPFGVQTYCTAANAVALTTTATRATWEATSAQLQWAGSSFLMPGWRAVEAAHAAAASAPDAAGVVVVLTDGEAHDAAALCSAFEKQLPPNLRAVLCLLGEGPNFERAFALFSQLRETQPRVDVVRLPCEAPAIALALECAFGKDGGVKM